MLLPQPSQHLYSSRMYTIGVHARPTMPPPGRMRRWNTSRASTTTAPPVALFASPADNTEICQCYLYHQKRLTQALVPNLGEHHPCNLSHQFAVLVQGSYTPRALVNFTQQQRSLGYSSKWFKQSTWGMPLAWDCQLQLGGDNHWTVSTTGVKGTKWQLELDIPPGEGSLCEFMGATVSLTVVEVCKVFYGCNESLPMSPVPHSKIARQSLALLYQSIIKKSQKPTVWNCLITIGFLKTC